MTTAKIAVYHCVGCVQNNSPGPPAYYTSSNQPFFVHLPEILKAFARDYDVPPTAPEGPPPPPVAPQPSKVESKKNTHADTNCPGTAMTEARRPVALRSEPLGLVAARSF